MIKDFLSLSRPLQTPFILSIPNEILHHILSFLPDLSSSEPFVYYKADGKDYRVAQMLVLRSVCRKIRDITPELDFWYDPDFLFADLATPEHIGSFMRPYYEQQFLKALFSDAGLVESLGRRKTDWRFESLEGVLSVKEYIPLFTENARTLYLEIVDPDEEDIRDPEMEPTILQIAMDLLSECEHVTTLNIRLGDNVDLDELAEAFPTLEVLNFSETNCYSGSLQELDHLRKLYLGCWDDDISTALSFLPLNSAETLTELTLNCRDVDNPVFHTGSLDAFVNLKSLNIGPLCDSICDFIIRAKIRLDIFETSLIRQLVLIDKFSNMLRAECLRELKEFGLSSRQDENSDRRITRRYWSRVFDVFTSTLLFVEEVQLDAPLHLQCCQYFARMVNLKLLNWDGTIHPVFGCVRASPPDGQIMRALDKVFANCTEKPQFAVHFLG
jgi:F-box domain